MTDSDSQHSIGNALTNPGKWPIERIRLLIHLRLEMEPQFRSGNARYLLWPQIYDKMKAVDPSLTEPLRNVQKKFNNMMLTYKRIKASSHSSQQTGWEFYQDFDDVLSQFNDNESHENDDANVHYVKTENNFDDDSVSFSSDDDNNTVTNYKNVVIFKQTPVVSRSETSNGIEVQRIVMPPKGPPRKKRKSTPDCSNVQTKTTTVPDVTMNDNSWFREFMIMSERKEQARHEQRLDMERKRIEVETKNTQVLRELVEIVKKFVNK